MRGHATSARLSNPLAVRDVDLLPIPTVTAVVGARPPPEDGRAHPPTHAQCQRRYCYYVLARDNKHAPRPTGRRQSTISVRPRRQWFASSQPSSRALYNIVYRIVRSSSYFLPAIFFSPSSCSDVIARLACTTPAAHNTHIPLRLYLSVRDMGTLDKHTSYKIDDVFKSNALVDIRACNKPVIKVTTLTLGTTRHYTIS